MVNMVDSMRRNLQRFVESDLCGVVRWDQVRVRVPADGQGEVVEIQFVVGPRAHTVSVASSDAKPPLGEVSLDFIAKGPIDQNTWATIAQQIKSSVAG